MGDSTVVITLAGVDVRTRVAGLTIRDVLNDAPNSCSLTIDGTEAPECEQALRVALNPAAPRLLFNGALQTVGLSYELRPGQVCYPSTAIDDTARANRMRPFGSWVAVSATLFAQQLITQFAPAFTTTHVQAGLPPVTILLDGTEGLSGALTQAAAQIGGYFYFEDGDLHFFITEATETPDPIDGTPGRLLDDPPIAVTRDDSQLRTRQYGRGHGEALLAAVPAAETILPVENAGAWFGTVTPAGHAIAVSQRLAYTGVQAPVGGALVGPGAAPSTAPALVSVDGAGLAPGTYGYAYTDVTAAGESLPSPSGSVAVTTMAAPSTAPFNNGSSSGGSLTNGYYHWAVTFVTSTGETVPGPSAFIWVNSITGLPQQQDLFDIPIGPAGTSARRIYRTAVGGTQLKYAGVITDNVAIQYFDGLADALLGANAPTVSTAVLGRVAVSGIAVGASPTTARKLYRTAANGAQLKLVATLANNTATTYTDSTPDAGLGANVPTGDTSGMTQPSGQVSAGSTTLLTSGAGPFRATGGWALIGNNLAVRYTGITGNTLTGIPASGPGAIQTSVTYGAQVLPAPALTGVTGLGPMGSPRLVLDVKAAPGGGLGTGVWQYAVTFSSASGQSLPSPPVTVTTGAGSFRVEIGPGILPVGATARNIYRTTSGGTQLKLLATTLAGFADTTADGSLGANAPTADTSGLTALVEPIAKGTPVCVWVQRDDLAAQAAQAAVDAANGILPADGIYEGAILVDERRNERSMMAACDAQLLQFARPIVTVTYACRDVKSKSGKTVVFALTPYVDAILADGPTAYWRFGEGAGALTFADASGHGHDATTRPVAVGYVTNGAAAAGATGITVRGGAGRFGVGRAFTLAGATYAVDATSGTDPETHLDFQPALVGAVPDGAPLVEASGITYGVPGVAAGTGLAVGHAEMLLSSPLAFTGPGSIEVWIRPRDLAVDDYAGIVQDGVNGFGLWLQHPAGAGIQVAWFDAAAAGWANVPLTPGALYHLVASVDAAGALAWYVNGARVTDVTPSAAPVDVTAVDQLAGVSYTSGSSLAADLLDEVAIYPNALTAAQVAAHYALRTAWALEGPHTIQEVTITEIDLAPELLPRFSCVASNARFSLDDILRRLLRAADAGANYSG